MRTNVNLLARVMTITLALMSTAGFLACKKATPPALIDLPVGKNDSRLTINTVPDTTLRDSLPFKIGVAINTAKLSVSAYATAAYTEFNSVTAEGAMKMKALQPTQGVFTFTDADNLVSFAAAHNMRVHGHTLIWDNVPTWVTNFSGDSTAWENIMKTHIDTVVKHFKGKVASWDVVNEAVADDGTLKHTIWYNHLGSGYIARAFQYAHAADPNAKLLYNDYGQEYSNNRRHGINNLIRSLLASGVPIDGVGMQMHMLKGQDTTGIRSAIDSSAATGLLVHVSEIDVALNTTNSATYTVTSADYTKENTIFQFVANKYKHRVSAAKRFGITTWSVDDADNWRNFTTSPSHPDWPVLLNGSFQHKACYGAFVYGALH